MVVGRVEGTFVGLATGEGEGGLLGKEVGLAMGEDEGGLMGIEVGTADAKKCIIFYDKKRYTVYE